MSNLFVEKSIEINAPAARVWQVLTRPELTRAWIREWWPDLAVLESDWQPGSPVLWKVSGGEVDVEGTVSAVEPYRLLRFSFRVNDPTTPRQEDITYSLEAQGEHTMLVVTVGDFGDSPQHRLCYPGAVESWNLSLPKIKELAETEKID